MKLLRLAFLGWCAWHVGLAAVLSAETNQSEDMQRAYHFQSSKTVPLDLRYWLFLPREYDADGPKRWPLIFFLHGAGERGTNLAAIKSHGPPKLVPSQPHFPFIVVSPQCPAEQRWDTTVLSALLDEIVEQKRVDTNRIYLTGLSMGGYGTWAWAAAEPHRFAAIAPICGGGNTIDLLLAGRAQGRALKKLPIWAFHGANDTTVTVSESERMVAAFKRLGNPHVKLTIYPETDHDSWTETYANPKLYDWFLQHSR